MKPSIIVVGFPKSGTSTLQKAFTESGIVSAHWKHDGKIVGDMVYNGWYDHNDPFHHFEGVEALTQMDYCRYSGSHKRILSVWPNLDIQLLLTIKRLYPNCKFILNYRDPEKTADSISRWRDLQDRLTMANCPNLPEGRGSQQEIATWIASHHKALRSVFKDDVNFLEIDIVSETAREKLEGFLERPLSWWGVANKNPGSDSAQRQAKFKRFAWPFRS